MLVGAEVLGYSTGGFELDAMALAVIERQAIAFKCLPAGDGEAGGGIETTAEQAYGAWGLKRHGLSLVANG